MFCNEVALASSALLLPEVFCTLLSRAELLTRLVHTAVVATSGETAAMKTSRRVAVAFALNRAKRPSRERLVAGSVVATSAAMLNGSCSAAGSADCDRAFISRAGAI